MNTRIKNTRKIKIYANADEFNYDVVEEIKNINDVFNVISRISRTDRRGFFMMFPEYESVASHMYKISFVITFIKHFVDFDETKAIKMALIHDIAEAYTKDYTPEDDIDKDVKHEIEDRIIKKMFKNFPEYIKIYNEYTNSSSKEAKIVHAIDKIDFGQEIFRVWNEFDKDEEIKRKITDNNKDRTEEIHKNVSEEILEYIKFIKSLDDKSLDVNPLDMKNIKILKT